MPVSAQQVGTYDLATSEVSASLDESLAGEECATFLGRLGAGTVELTSLDAERVDFVLDAEPPHEAPSGTYSAPRCP